MRFAELQDGAALIAKAAEVVEMIAHELDDLLDRRRRGDHAGGEETVRVAEDPGRAERGPADHQALATRVADHPLRVQGRADVAVADDGDVFDRGDDLGDAVEAGFAGKTHLGRAAMDGDGGDADFFEPGGQIRRDQARVVPAEAELAGQRDISQG